MKPSDLREVLNWDACVECGECLVNCRYIEFSREEAVREIKKINRGDTAGILEKCVSCYACDAFCPHGAHPYERIISGWDERNKRQGLPLRAAYLMPGRRPNFREDIRFYASEKEILKKWNQPEPPAETVLYPGCNLLAMPFLATGKIFELLPVWGNFDLCCGEMFFRTGNLDKARQIAERLTLFYRDKPLREMVFVCPACYNMFTNVLPQQFGAHFSFKTTFLTDWLTAALDDGRLTVNRPLTGSVVMHDSCHARVLGGDFMESQRAILKRLGLTVHETPENRKHGLCCGMAAGANRFSVVDLVKNALRQLLALDRADGDAAAIYCTGCLLMLSCVRPLSPFGKPLVHPLEYIRRALGETVPRRNIPRSLSITAGILSHSLPWYFSRGTFRP
jgi:Fe-S oxidoreductase